MRHSQGSNRAVRGRGTLRGRGAAQDRAHPDARRQQFVARGDDAPRLYALIVLNAALLAVLGLAWPLHTIHGLPRPAAQAAPQPGGAE